MGSAEVQRAGVRRRVAMVAHSHVLGGIEQHVVTLSAELARQGHAVAYAGPSDGWLGAQMRAAGHTCIDLPMNGMYDPVSAWRLARFARRWGADVLHGHALRGGRYADWAGRWSGVPAVATAHSTNAWKWFSPRRRLIAVSEAVRGFLLDKGLPAELVRVVYSGVPDVGPMPAPDGAALSPQRPLVLGMIARFEAVKGHDLALRALAELGPGLPVRLRLAGADTTAWGREVHAQVQALGLGEVVEFLGQRSDVPDVLARLDVVLAPSRRESLCLSLVEAGAAGRPGIAARVGGIPEVLGEDEGGLLVPPEDPHALAGAIRRLAAQPALRLALGAAARRRYEQRFTLAAMREGVEAVYDAAIHAGGSPGKSA
ncbi:glycosyltransferase family 4 protein [Aquincola sp. MAHUQ-54]|uniref:Glycosyltransferase family 4 protein n=1 Tax=Aquincola agrisoli TaxID=3119538 RepID=A0AAW9QP24_9BURK